MFIFCSNNNRQSSRDRGGSGVALRLSRGLAAFIGVMGLRGLFLILFSMGNVTQKIHIN